MAVSTIGRVSAPASLPVSAPSGSKLLPKDPKPVQKKEDKEAKGKVGVVEFGWEHDRREQGKDKSKISAEQDEKQTSKENTQTSTTAEPSGALHDLIAFFSSDLWKGIEHFKAGEKFQDLQEEGERWKDHDWRWSGEVGEEEGRNGEVRVTSEPSKGGQGQGRGQEDADDQPEISSGAEIL
eukprot:768253-Hanusia_phi.AAC.8